MKYVVLPNEIGEPLSFYLAAEEYVARYFSDESEYFFMWQVDPTVIFGRNQLIENEVNLAYCREHNIAMFRRKSGGGCVYADRDNIMFSYINSTPGAQLTFDRYLEKVSLLLQKLGLNATASSRNDVLIDGRKVSGNAFYRVGNRNIVHGTMLYDTNLENMVGSITPSSEKLRSKGVESVRSRITLLKDHISLTQEGFKQFVREGLCDGEVVVDQQGVDEICRIEQQYLTERFIYGNNPRFSVEYTTRVDHCGEFTVKLAIKNGVIREADLHGDFFLTGELDSLLARIVGVRREKEALSCALEGFDTSAVIMNLSPQQFVDLITQQ